MTSLLMLVSVAGALDLALKSTAVVLAAVVVAAVLRRASAAWRHLVWSVSVASVLLLPVLSLLLPHWRVAWLPQWTAMPTQRAAAGQTGFVQAARTAPLEEAFHTGTAAVLPPVTTGSQAEPRAEPLNLPPATVETNSLPRSAAPWLAIAWSAGALLSLVPLAIGLWQLAGIHRRSQAVADVRWLALLDELRRQLGVRRGVQLRQCESALAPLTWGALRPVLLVSFEAAAWPDERRRLVLLHELAHVRRWDWLTQLVAHVACAAYWFNPLVWLAARQMRIERERACDDMVLASGARASDYARELLALAARLSTWQVSALVAVPMARGGSLNDRLHGILDRRRSRRALTRSAVCLGAALAAAFMAPLAMLRAAPPESRESVTEPKKPPAEPVGEVAPTRPQVVEVDDGHPPSAPPALANDEVKEIWNVTLEEAVRTALANSKVVRNLGGQLFMPVGTPTNLNHAAGNETKDSIGDRNAGRVKVRFVLTRTKGDVAPADFEAGLRSIVGDVERAYWELYYNYRNLNAVQAGRDSALQTWREIRAHGGEAETAAQAREQYFLFRAQVENTLGLLYTAESRLRYMMGVAPTDGRLIRPDDDPTTAEVRFDWKAVLSEGLNRSVAPSVKEELSGKERERFEVLTRALRDLNRNYQVSRTTFNRRTAAGKQVEAVKAAYDVGTASLDMLLDAQRRLADAEIAYYRALVDYNFAISQVHLHKGSLLEHHGVLLTEGTGERTEPIDPFRPRVLD